MTPKNVLLIGTAYMNIYKDIVNAFVKKGYYVDFIPERSHKDDPNNIRGHKGLRKKLSNRFSKFEEKNIKYWESKLKEETYSKKYDVLFVLDGQSIDKSVFKELVKRNPEIKKVNYLFDTTKHVYRFDQNFKYFDKVYTFDLNESRQFHVNFLPIYWVKDNSDGFYRDIYGFGAYKDSRFLLFKQLRKIADEIGKSYYLKLYTPAKKTKGIKGGITRLGNNIRKNHTILYKIYWQMLSLKNKLTLMPPPVLMDFPDSEYETHDTISPSQFRAHINQSNVIVDTIAENQDGLTARFMWALGAEKKIITTNTKIKEYNFYTPEQIFIVDDTTLDINDSEVKNFLENPYVMGEEIRKYLSQFEIDNWLDTIIA